MRFLLLLLVSSLSAQRIPWDIDALSRPPKVYETASAEPGVRALFFESVRSKGKPTRVFAYYGAPGRRNGERLPAMVLIHGGGGTAFAEWVRLWNSRGYAAIAMDTCGAIPDKALEENRWSPAKKRHEFGGPAGWGGFAQIDEAVEDQWTYHAVAAAVLGHSLIRSFPEVDPKRIGVTGISWGGYLTAIVSGIDPRFRFAAPVYGCGFLGEDSAWLKDFERLGPERATKWLSLWDPSRYLPTSGMPMLWVTGTNDFAYPFPSLQKSYRLPKGPRTLAIRVAMPHGHPQGALPEEIHAYADAILLQGRPLAAIAGVRFEENRLSLRYKSKRLITKAELNYTTDEGRWQDRKWTSLPARLDPKNRSAGMDVPAGARAWYLNLFDSDGLVVSCEHQIR